MERITEKKFKALGFIDVLIAIVVVGIVSSVFLSIAGNTMKELIQAERVENMARLAKDGVNVAQEIANQEKANLNPTVTYFPHDSGDEGKCFIPLREGTGVDVEYSFEEDSGFVAIPEANRSDIVNHVKESGLSESYLAGDQYFVVMCIPVGGVDTGTGWANVKIWVGDTDLQGEVTSDSDVKDFTFYSVIDL
jgi:type II secretory pathway pseudopilin PulG